jgi:exopolysaccharide biosynthesis predicted pyruvyltransferase EpsI
MGVPTSLNLSLRERLTTTVGESFPERGPCALMGYPTHGNIGDHVLWLGQSELLRSLGMRVTHVGNIFSYDPARVNKACPSGPLVITGGGNTGDVWPKFQNYRERIVRDFPHRKIVQLPQSVSFSSSIAAERFGDAVRAHGNVAFMTRDSASRQALLDGCGIESRLCPDVAYMLDCSAFRKPSMPVRWILRRDKEAKGYGSVPGAIDWLETRTLRALVARGFPLFSPLFGGRSPFVAEAISKVLLRKGIDLVSSGKVLVTDRLHAAILATLLGVPCVAIDNSYGKVHGFFNTWLGGDANVLLATSIAEAQEKAAGLVGRS